MMNDKTAVWFEGLRNGLIWVVGYLQFCGLFAIQWPNLGMVNTLSRLIYVSAVDSADYWYGYSPDSHKNASATGLCNDEIAIYTNAHVASVIYY